MGPQIGIAILLLIIAVALAFGAVRAFRTPRLANAIVGLVACAFAVLFGSVAIVGLVGASSVPA